MSLQEKLKGFEEALKSVPPEQQQEKLNELLSTLTPEELEDLKKQQCILCSIVAGNIETTKIYEDDKVIAALDINPASPGHVILFPRNHAAVLAMVPDEMVGHMFMVANKIASALFESMQAEGTNIYVANGPAAGQTTPHILVNIIPRYKEDGIKFEWTFGKTDPEELKKIAEKIKEKVVVPQFKEVEEVVQEEEPEEEEEDDFYQRPKIP